MSVDLIKIITRGHSLCRLLCSPASAGDHVRWIRSFNGGRRYPPDLSVVQQQPTGQHHLVQPQRQASGVKGDVILPGFGARRFCDTVRGRRDHVARQAQRRLHLPGVERHWPDRVHLHHPQRTLWVSMFTHCRSVLGAC